MPVGSAAPHAEQRRDSSSRTRLQGLEVLPPWPRRSHHAADFAGFGRAGCPNAQQFPGPVPGDVAVPHSLQPGMGGQPGPMTQTRTSSGLAVSSCMVTALSLGVHTSGPGRWLAPTPPGLLFDRRAEPAVAPAYPCPQGRLLRSCLQRVAVTTTIANTASKNNNGDQSAREPGFVPDFSTGQSLSDHEWRETFAGHSPPA
jgi:hypothetical protein